MMAHTDDSLDPPRRSGADHALNAAKVGIGAIPWIGSAAVEAINGFFASPYDRKLHEWRVAMAQVVQQLRHETSELCQKSLQGSQKFQEVVILASDVASKSDPVEVYPALKHAIIAAGSASDTSRDMLLRILRALKLLTSTHIRLLRYFATNAWADEKAGHLRAHLRRDERNAYLTDEQMEKYVESMRCIHYYSAFSGVDLADVSREDSKVFIDDLHKEGLLLSPIQYSERDESPLTPFGARLLELLDSPEQF
ncbi:MAG TPA: hypothetical protein PKK06_08395 [Phycisphaerae bacterium]|nr:hypothetical protein [Phycisphaerae bacterium]HNU43671.1 hypothetical protein [Phycisphaerae bacterium]